MTEYLFVGVEGNVLKQYDIEAQKFVKTWHEIDSNNTYVVAIPENGKFLFMGSMSHELFQYALADGALVKDWGVIADNFINSIKASSCGEFLFTASMDENLTQFSLANELDNNSHIAKLPNENTFLMELFAVEGREYLFTVSDGKFLKQFHIAPKLTLKKDWGALEGFDASIECIAFSAPHCALFTTFAGSVSQWDLKQGGLVRRIEAHKASILSMIVNPKGTMLFACAEDGRLKQFRIESGELELDWAEVKGVSSGMEDSLAIDGGSEWMFTAEEGELVRQWSLTNVGHSLDIEEVYVGWMPLVIVKY